jgi:uncharacterized membrane protein YcaP (DUF421 family)
MFGLPGIFWPANGGLDLALQLVVRTVLVYLFFLIAMRAFGKREVGQFTMPDLVLVLLAANALQPAITGPDSSIGGALIILVTMFVLNSIVSGLRARSQLVDRLVSPDPTAIYGGAAAEPQVPESVHAQWRAEGLTRQDVFEALHEQGLESLDQVERIYLEESGRITVIPRSAPVGAA